MLRPLTIELRRSPMVLLFPVLLATATYIFVVQLAKSEGQWPGVLASVNWTIILTGPLIAGVSAWIGGRERRRNMSYLRDLSAHPPGKVLLAPLLATAIWAAAALTATLLIGLGWGIWTDSWGWPSPTEIIRFLAAGTVFVPLPFIAGHAFPRKLTPPLVALLTYLFMVVVEVYLSAIWPLYALSPLPGTTGTIWYQFNAPLAVGQALWLAGSSSVVVIAWLLVLDRGQQTRRAPLTSALSIAAVCAAFGVAATIYEGGVVYTDESAAYQPICSEYQPTVCVHPAFKKSLPGIQESAHLLQQRLATTPAAFDHLQQAQAGGDPPLGRGDTPTFSLLSVDSGATSTALQQLVDQSFLQPCSHDPGNVDKALLQQLVTQWLVTPSATTFTPYLGGPAADSITQAAAFFSGLDENGRRAWLAAYYPSFAACSLDAAMFSNGTPG